MTLCVDLHINTQNTNFSDHPFELEMGAHLLISSKRVYIKNLEELFVS